MSRKRTEDKPDIRSREGFEKIYCLYWEKLLAICFNLTRDRALAEGMVQDIFKSLWERRASMRIEKSIEHYLVRSAKVRVLEHFRNQAIRRKHVEYMLYDYAGAVNSTEEEVDLSLLKEELNKWVELLPPQCRHVFKMSREEGMSNKEIAENLGITVRAVEYHINRAVGFLKEKLNIP